MQRVTPGIGNAFRPVETALKETFVPALFEVMVNGVPERRVALLPVKQAVLALPDPSQTAPDKWTASCVITGHLVASLRGQVEFRTADHSACLREGRMAVQRRGQRRAGEALMAALEGGGGLTRTSTATSDKDWVLADSTAVHSQWDGDWGKGMTRRPLPAVCHQSPGPSNTLLRLTSQFFHQSRP